MKIKNFWTEAIRPIGNEQASCELSSLTEPGQAAPIHKMIEMFRQGEVVKAKPHYYDDIDGTLDDETMADMAPDDEPDPLIKAQNAREELDELERRAEYSKLSQKHAAIRRAKEQRAKEEKPGEAPLSSSASTA